MLAWDLLYLMRAGSVGGGKATCQSVDKFCQNTVIPAEAGIQRSGVNSIRLDSGFRRNDEKTKHVDRLTDPQNHQIR